MNVLKPFDVGITSNEDAIRDLEDYNPLEGIVTGKGFEVVKNDYDIVNAFVPGYSFEKMVEESRVEFSEKRVSYLGLNSMGLECLSGEIGRLDGLRELYLSGNGLSVLPAEIGSLTKLRELNLSNNSLSVLPVEIGNLGELKALYLCDNGFSVLPIEIGNLVNLKSLSLTFNQFTSLSVELCDLANLKKLWISGNNVSDYSTVRKLREKGVEVHE